MQAKGGTDKLSLVQIEQDFALSAEKFPSLLCQPVAAQCMADGVIALFRFSLSEDHVSLVSERHYKLVPAEQVTSDDQKLYRTIVDESTT